MRERGFPPRWFASREWEVSFVNDVAAKYPLERERAFFNVAAKYPHERLRCHAGRKFPALLVGETGEPTRKLNLYSFVTNFQAVSKLSFYIMMKVRRRVTVGWLAY